MNVALSSRHTVHLGRETGGIACHIFGAPHGTEAYRATTREVTCKKCLKILAQQVEVEVAPVEVATTETVEVEVAPVAETVETVEVVAEVAESVIVATLNGRAPVWMTVYQGRQMWAARGVCGLYTSKHRATAAYRRTQAATVLQR